MLSHSETLLRFAPVWNTAQKILRSSVGDDALDALFPAIRLERIEGRTVVLSVLHADTKKRIEESAALKEQLRRALAGASANSSVRDIVIELRGFGYGSVVDETEQQPKACVHEIPLQSGQVIAYKRLCALMKEVSRNPALSVDVIRCAVADHFGVQTEDINTTTRVQRVSEARCVAQYLVVNLLNVPAWEAAILFARVESTIHKTVDDVINRLDSDSEFQKHIEQILETLRNHA